MSRTRGEVVRYVAVGAFATVAHYATLVTGVHVLGVQPVGLANFFAAVVGSVCAFLGHRTFVFVEATGSVASHMWRFAAVYFAAALFQGGFLYLWSDMAGLNYSIGFVVATAIQIVGVYLCNKLLVFR